MTLYIFLVRFDHKAGYRVIDVQADTSHEAYQQIVEICDRDILQIVDSIELVYHD